MIEALLIVVLAWLIGEALIVKMKMRHLDADMTVMAREIEGIRRVEMTVMAREIEGIRREMASHRTASHQEYGP